MVRRLDRLARSVADLHTISKELEAKGVERQLEGIAKAKEEGRYKGRPITVNYEAILAALTAGDKPMAVATRFNVARSTVYRVMSEGATKA